MINNNNDDYREEMQRYQEYIEALEEENRKIQVFQRELPLCLELVTQAIERCRQQFHGQLLLEQFIPIKKTSSSEDFGQQSHKPNNISKNRRKYSKSSDKSSKKSDWLRSVQLWNQTPDAPIKEDSPRKVKREKTIGKSRASMGRSNSLAAAKAVGSSSAETVDSSGGGGGGGIKSKGKGRWQRKARRSWSPELHRRFLEAIQQLGGSDVATPKQIRELMKVDELSNDEVKSHLQKYRLHSRRPSPSIHNNHHQPPHQFVVVGGIWLPPPEYAVVATPTSTPNTIYTPTAALPPPLPQTSASLNRRQQHKPFHSAKRGSHSEGGAHSNSPATSSSTHTTTASPGF